jgi:hypothetical protein
VRSVQQAKGPQHQMPVGGLGFRKGLSSSGIDHRPLLSPRSKMLEKQKNKLPEGRMLNPMARKRDDALEPERIDRDRCTV